MSLQMPGEGEFAFLRDEPTYGYLIESGQPESSNT